MSLKTAKSLYQFNFVNFGGVPYGFEWIWSQNNLDHSFLCQKIGIPVFYLKNFSTCRGLKIPGFTTDREMEDGNAQWTIFEGQ